MLAVPLEVVVGLAELAAGRAEPADAGVVAGLSGTAPAPGRRRRADGSSARRGRCGGGGADRGLVAAGDQGRAAGRADRRGDEGLAEPRSLARQADRRAASGSASRRSRRSSRDMSSTMIQTIFGRRAASAATTGTNETAESSNASATRSRSFNGKPQATVLSSRPAGRDCRCRAEPGHRRLRLAVKREDRSRKSHHGRIIPRWSRGCSAWRSRLHNCGQSDCP